MATYNLDESNSIYSSSKRMKNNQGQSVSVLRNTLPSCVIHVRGLAAHVTESDLIQALQRYGSISYVMTFPAKNMALVEFDNLESAIRLMTFAKENEITVAGMPAHFNYSVSEKIKRPDYESKMSLEVPPSNVILLTIINARHPITVDVIYAICSPIANVVRVVIFRKNGVQVLVEFENIEDATKVKNNLHGADIYANSCTIKAEFGKPNNLTVRRNDQNTWDYTVSPPAPNYGYSKSKPLLADPGNNHGFESHNAGFNPFGQTGHSSVSSSGAGGGYRVDYDATMLDAYGGASLHGALDQSFQNPNCVLMIYGLNSEKFNCQKLFNLICLYGDVVKIRFLKSKDGSAMVQMVDRESCDRVMMMLRDVTVFGNKLSISNSKQPYVSESTSPSFTLPDGTSSFQDFTGSKNNRFGSPDALKKYRVQFPTKVVYFFNAPPNIDEETMMLPFIKAGAVPPSRMVMLPAKTERSSRGYLTFPDAVTATESLLVANNAKLPNPNGTAPYVIKLAFSAASPEDGH